MRVLTKNIQLIFTCENEGCKNEKSQDRFESDPYELTTSGIPICPECNEQMVVDEYCFIKN